MDTRKIVKARIEPGSGGIFGTLPQVMITLEGEEEQRLFDYYPDEISFTADEFIGLTRAQAVELKFNKDKAYLQS
jgi:hypothetical protein